MKKIFLSHVLSILERSHGVNSLTVSTVGACCDCVAAKSEELEECSREQYRTKLICFIRRSMCGGKLLKNSAIQIARPIPVITYILTTLLRAD